MAAYTAIDDVGSFFNTVLYTGNDGTGHAITGAGFQPDITWIKNRDASDFHVFTDSVRGATNYLIPDDGGAEITNAESLQSFDTDGFTVGNIAQINTSPEAYASWNWKAGTTSGITTDGSTTITPSAYSFNQTAGISIIKYAGNSTSGAKVAHGLGVTPNMMIVKNIDANDTWTTYTDYTGNTKYLVLNTTAATDTQTNRWNDTSPDSVNLTVGNSTAVNNSGNDYLGLIFANVQGFSRFGVYFGNSNVNGPLVYCGFRPAFIIIKRPNHTTDWQLFDSKRLGYNVDNNNLYPNLTNGEGTGDILDILSTGFKLRTADSAPNPVNGNTAPYVFFAFAESPFVNSESVPNNAR